MISLSRIIESIKMKIEETKKERLLDEVSFMRGDTEYTIKYFLQKGGKTILKEVWYQEWEGEFSPQKVGETMLDYRELIKLS